MKKNKYIEELKSNKAYVALGYTNDKKDVKKVQEWINLWKYLDNDWNITIGIDGDFGPNTKAAVIEFQRHFGLEPDGIVGNITWQKLTEPMRKAFSRIDGIYDFREMVVAYASQHLNSAPREYNQNQGTWVRAYMDGYEGNQWPWCAGFAETIIDQAAFTLGDNLVKYLPFTYSCDVLGNFGIEKGQLLLNSEIKNSPGKIEPGDLFLILKSKGDWIHTGIVTGRDGEWINTIEGNTNDEGSREGFEVCRRKRCFTTKNIDILKIV